MTIHCPNCQFEGDAKNARHEDYEFSLCMFLIGSSVYLSSVYHEVAVVFLGAAVALFLYFTSRRKTWACPICGFKNPIPVEFYQKHSNENERKLHVCPKLTEMPNENALTQGQDRF